MYSDAELLNEHRLRSATFDTPFIDSRGGLPDVEYLASDNQMFPEQRIPHPIWGAVYKSCIYRLSADRD